MAAESKADKKEETKTEETKKDEQEKPVAKARTVQQGEARSSHCHVEDSAGSATDVKACYALIQESVRVLEPRYITRVLKLLPSIRKRLDVIKLKEVLDSQYPPGEHFLCVCKHCTNMVQQTRIRNSYSSHFCPMHQHLAEAWR